MANASFIPSLIPLKAENGNPTVHYIVDDDGGSRPVTRVECLAHDEQGVPNLIVDPDGTAVYRLPRTALGEQLARENMQSIWQQDKYSERWAKRQFSINDLLTGTDSGSRATADVTDIAEEAALLRTLIGAVAELTSDDQYLLKAIFVDGKTERELALELGLKERKSVNKRKNRILEILRNHPALKSFAQEIS